MANLVHNIAKGRFAEWAERSRTAADASGAIIIAPFDNTGASTDDNIRDCVTLAAIEALSGLTERVGTWNRKSISDGNVTVTIDHTNNRVDVDVADQTWTAVILGDGATTNLEFAYDSDTGAGTDANVLPGTWNDFAVTPDGSDVTAQIAVFYRAS